MSGPRAWLLLGLLVLILWLFQKAKGLFWVFSCLVLPGTFCHECCHYLTGLALNGRPVAFTILPRHDGEQIQLGAVHLANLRWYNVFFIGMAPLAMLPAAYYLFLWILRQGLPLGLPLVLWSFLVANLVYGSIPSPQDLRLAARSPVGWVLLGAVLYLGWTRLQGDRPRPVRAAVVGRHRRAG